MKKVLIALFALMLVLGATAVLAAPPSPDPQPCQSGDAGTHNKHCQEEPPPPGTCEDGIDNDEDGVADAEDSECTDPEDGEEDGSDVPLGTCEDGIDNDEDGVADAEDSECTDPEDGEEDGSDAVVCPDGIITQPVDDLTQGELNFLLCPVHEAIGI